LIEVNHKAVNIHTQVIVDAIAADVKFQKVINKLWLVGLAVN
jgi:hypothetical protein